MRFPFIFKTAVGNINPVCFSIFSQNDLMLTRLRVRSTTTRLGRRTDDIIIKTVDW